MRNLFRNAILVLSVIVLSAGFTSCEEDNGGKEEPTNTDELYKSILAQYVDKTVVPTYKAMAEAALEMRAANEALKENPTDANMKTASDAWMKARIWWEKSEAFLFGPVGEDALDIDGHIDSWPLELIDIQTELNKIKADLNNGGKGLTGKKAWGEMNAEVIGFHVTEYLLYREGKSRTIANLLPEELNYLTAATDALVWDCVMAYVAWVGEENVSSEMRTIFNENPEVVAFLNKNSNYKNFANSLKSATGNYASFGFAAAFSEISEGIITISGEVGATKIAEPYNSGKVEDVESWYSWHSLDDYQNNIHSIKNAYMGGLDEQTRTTTSLSSYVKGKDAQLDSEIKAKIEDCITKIQAIGGTGNKSFYEVVRDHINQSEVNAAVEACADLEALFKKVKSSIE